MLKKIKSFYAKPFLHKEFEPNSRPENYPIPDVEDMLFFIQRNYNTDTIIYQLNFDRNGLINLNEPIKVFWLKYGGGGVFVDLNYMQKKLAYGYSFDVITNELISFEFVSYPKRFFLAKQNDGTYRVCTQINDQKSFFTHAYIYAEENGIFPDVKFIELYGNSLDGMNKVYEKLVIE